MADYLDTLPADLEAAHVKARHEFSVHMSNGRWRAALFVYEQVYNQMLARQATGKRFHKGESLANMGLAKLFGNQPDEALRLMTMALIEDALSKGDERVAEALELHMPAAHNLVYVFAVPGPFIANAALWVRNQQASSGNIPDPSAVVDINPFRDMRGAALTVGPRLVGRFLGPWERRVFLGGSYKPGHMPRLTTMQEEVDAVGGFEPVLVADYAIPADMTIHDHALLLLHECGIAIFDLSDNAGQLIELDRVWGYPTPPSSILLVYDSTVGGPQAGAMSRSEWEKRGLDPKPYASFDELRVLVRDFLASLKTSP